MFKYFSCIAFFLTSLWNISLVIAQTNPAHPNILLIIGDDIGVDYTNGYQQNASMPTTPTLDSLRTAGITFKNAWAAPVCAPTRATIMSGKYGVKTGVLTVPGNLNITHSSIFKEITSRTNGTYAQALFGKWHLSDPTNLSHPQEHGLDHHEGVIGGGVGDYYNWNKVTNGERSDETEYVTTHLTSRAIDWINTQNQPWFVWLAHSAAHTPFHTPPDGLYSITSTQNNQNKYIAAIEAMDSEIARLLRNIPADELANTLIIYLGDNGTPGRVLQAYADGQSKGSLYQGGIHVPMIVAGAGVRRKNVEEEALVHSVDLYATLLETIGVSLPGGIYNSLSFYHLLSEANGISRPFNYSEVGGNNTPGWTIRDVQYKLINFNNNTQEFYDLLNDPLETTNLIGDLSDLQQNRKVLLEEEALRIRTDWSCRDLIQNGTEDSIDSCNPDLSTALNEIDNTTLSIYPNPTKDYLKIDFSGESDYEVCLFDISGKAIFLAQNSTSLNLSKIKQGTYYLEISLLKASQKMVKKIVVVK